VTTWPLVALAAIGVVLIGLVLWDGHRVSKLREDIHGEKGLHARVDVLGDRQDLVDELTRDIQAWWDEGPAWPVQPPQDAQDGPADPDGHTDTPQDVPDAPRGAQPVDRVNVPLPPVPPTQAIPRTDPNQPVPEAHPETQPAIDRRGAGRWTTGPGGSLVYRAPGTDPEENR
jgi:hypothetical protein